MWGSTRRGFLKTLGAGLTLAVSSESTVAESSPPADQQSKPYAVAWNEVTDFGSSGWASKGPIGGRRHDLVRTRGGYVAPGLVHRSDFSEDDRGLLEKYDTNGVRVFKTTLGEEGHRLSGATTLGSRYVGVGDAGTDGWIVSVDTYGQTVWETRVGEDSHEATLNGTAVANGRVVAAGQYNPSEQDFLGWAMQYDPSGERAWEQRFRPSDASGLHWFNDVTTTQDGDYLMVGRGRHGGNAGVAWSVRVTADGTEKWNRLHPVEAEIGGGRHGGDREEANGVIPVEDGGFLLVGLSRAAVSDGWAAMVVKLESDGTIAWTRLFDTHRFVSATDATVTKSGEYLVTGATGGVGSHFWVASLNPDGSLNWREEYLGTHTEKATSIATAPGGAVVAGQTRSRGSTNWPMPWLARLDADTQQAPDGFDPRVHGFGFGNWAGKEGVRKNGESFILPYHDTAPEDATRWVLGLDEPIDRVEDLWDGGIELAEGLYRRQISTDGHCLGMVLAADHYFQSPEDLPRGVQFTQSVPHPTGRYESVGERIRTEQNSFGHGRTATQLILALNAPFTDPQPNLEKIRRSLSKTGTAPIALAMETAAPDQQNGKKGTENLFHSGLVYHWEETDDAVELYYYDPNDPAENYKSPDEVYGVELDEEDSHLDRAFEKPRHSLRIDPETGELLDNTHPRGRTVTVYSYFPVGRGAAVEDTFETESDEGDQGSDTQDTLADLSSESEPTRDESGDDEYSTLEYSPDSEFRSTSETVDRPAITLPSLLESAVIATLDSPGKLTMHTPDGQQITSADGEYVYKDATEYSEMVWAVGMDPGEIRLAVEPETDEPYTLRVMGNVAAGGHVSKTIKNSVSGDAVQKINVTLTDKGTGSVTVVTPESSNEKEDSSGTNSAAVTEASNNAGPSGPGFEKEVLAGLGILALVASGYVTLRIRD